MAQDKEFIGLRKHFGSDHFPEKSDAAVDFYTAVAFLLMDLDFILETAQPIRRSTGAFGIADAALTE